MSQPGFNQAATDALVNAVRSMAHPATNWSLLKRGADPDPEGDGGLVEEALRQGDIESFNYLVDAGAVVPLDGYPDASTFPEAIESFEFQHSLAFRRTSPCGQPIAEHLARFCSLISGTAFGEKLASNIGFLAQINESSATFNAPAYRALGVNLGTRAMLEESLKEQVDLLSVTCIDQGAPSDGMFWNPNTGKQEPLIVCAAQTGMLSLFMRLCEDDDAVDLCARSVAPEDLDSPVRSHLQEHIRALAATRASTGIATRAPRRPVGL